MPSVERSEHRSTMSWALRSSAVWGVTALVLAGIGVATRLGPEFPYIVLALVGGLLCGSAVLGWIGRLRPTWVSIAVHLGLIAIGGGILFLSISRDINLVAGHSREVTALLITAYFALLPATAIVALGLLGRISFAARTSGTPLQNPEWDRRDGVSRVTVGAIPAPFRVLTIGIIAAVLVGGALTVAIAIATDGTFLHAGPRFLIVACGLLIGLPLYLLLRAKLQAQTVTATIGFEPKHLSVLVGEQAQKIQYGQISTLVWRTDTEYARLDVHYAGQRLSLLVGFARQPRGMAAALPTLQPHMEKLLTLSGLHREESRRAALVEFVRVPPEQVAAL